MVGRIIFSSVGPGVEVDQRYVDLLEGSGPRPVVGFVKVRGDERDSTVRTALARAAAVDIDLFGKVLPGQADLLRSLDIHSPTGDEVDTTIRPGLVVLGGVGAEAAAAEVSRRLESTAFQDPMVFLIPSYLATPVLTVITHLPTAEAVVIEVAPE